MTMAVNSGGAMSSAKWEDEIMCDIQIPSQKPVSQNSAAKCTFPFTKRRSDGVNVHHHWSIYVHKGSVTLYPPVFKNMSKLTNDNHFLMNFTLYNYVTQNATSSRTRWRLPGLLITRSAVLGTIFPACKHKQTFSICPYSYWDFSHVCIFQCLPAGL